MSDGHRLVHEGLNVEKQMRHPLYCWQLPPTSRAGSETCWPFFYLRSQKLSELQTNNSWTLSPISFCRPERHVLQMPQTLPPTPR